LGAVFLRIAYIHQKHTGFKFKEDAFQKELRIDHLKWVNGDPLYVAPEPAHEAELALESDFTIDVHSAQQTLRLRSVASANGYKYRISYKTIIFDAEIKSLVDNIPTEAKYQPLKQQVALELLKRQIESVPVMVLEPQLKKGPK
jgi:hypothetical protein